MLRERDITYETLSRLVMKRREYGRSSFQLVQILLMSKVCARFSFTAGYVDFIFIGALMRGFTIAAGIWKLIDTTTCIPRSLLNLVLNVGTVRV